MSTTSGNSATSVSGSTPNAKNKMKHSLPYNKRVYCGCTLYPDITVYRHTCPSCCYVNIFHYQYLLMKLNNINNSNDTNTADTVNNNTQSRHLTILNYIKHIWLLIHTSIPR